MFRRSSSSAPVLLPSALPLVCLMATVLAGCPPAEPENLLEDAGSPGEGEGEGEGDRSDGGTLPPTECAEPTNKVVTSSPGAIYNGTRPPTLLPLDAAQANAVVAIGDASLPGEGAFCSGTLIADTVVLTAEHCTAGAAASELVVLFGPDDHAPLLVVPVVEKQETDPTTDMALLRLARAPAEEIDVRPIPVSAVPLADSLTGTLLEQAGFGATDDGSTGRFFVTEVFTGMTSQFVVVDGQGIRGVCFGDSGGPTMHLGGAGEVRVFGVLSFGDPECMNEDNFSRVDTQLDFIEAMTGPTVDATPQTCGAELTEQGACDVHQAIASWCQDDVVARRACAPDEVCAAEDDGRRRCIPQAQNPCGAVTHHGSCDGQQLEWCDGDVVRTRDCVACGERCILLSPTDGYGCVPSDCGALTEEGVCDGSVARWCDDAGQHAEYDCGSDGLTCAYVGPILGNYCYDADACEGLTYVGTCEGTVLRWCEDGEVIEVDCASEGAACVDTGDPAVGFVCE